MIRSSSLAVVPLLACVMACSGRPRQPEASFDAASGLAKVRAARADLVRAWDTLDELRGELSAFARKQHPTPGELAATRAAEARLAEVETAFDAAYHSDQAALAEFLNEALNSQPAAPETLQALDLYAASAMRNAHDFVTYAGDYRRAIELLDTAQGYFASVALEVPAELKEAIRLAREYRVLTKARFDRLAAGMSEEEARALTGVPHHANIRHSQVGGKPVTSWLFGREDGGIAALYFSSGRLYAWRWEIRQNPDAVARAPASGS